MFLFIQWRLQQATIKTCFRYFSKKVALEKKFQVSLSRFFFFLTKLGSKQQVSANFRVKFFQQQKRQFSCINYTLEWIRLGRRRNESRLRKRKKKNKSWRDNNRKLFKKLLLSLFFLPWSFSDCNYPSIEVLKEYFLRTLRSEADSLNKQSSALQRQVVKAWPHENKTKYSYLQVLLNFYDLLF